jgi:COPII coat assembly protein SEC16
MTSATGHYSPQSQLSPPSQRTQAKTQSYSPLRAEHNAAQLSYGSPYMPTPPVEDLAAAPSFGGGQPSQPAMTQSFDDNPPPSSSFDDTPSYQPYNPDEEDKEEDKKPKKKSFMDDDDDEDLVARAAALKIGSSSKSDADRKADEAFRKAAEADAKRDKEAAAKKGGGWLSGWFKKDPNAAPGPIKAKLGEESSFFYDPDLGKWVNKKGGASGEPERATATPPPPKGPPMGARSASGGAMAPPAGPPSGLMKPPTSAPQRSSSMPPPMALPGSRSSTPGIPSDNEGGPKPPTLARPSFGAASGPPSRPGTGMSTASSIDDLLGAPQARKGAGAKKKKGGRYVDVFPQGQAS